MKPIVLRSCPKVWNKDLDKAQSPAQTIARARKRLAAFGADIVAETRRVDIGRLGIPVFLGVCGKDAKAVMPTRKQMGKGSSPEQAEASAIMEVMERFAFFSFWQRAQMTEATWDEAEKLFGQSLIPISEIARSVNDNLPDARAKEIFNLCRWRFYPATHLQSGRLTWLPLDWFRMLGEFNGSSAGNAAEESLLQGISELVERHVCCIAARNRPILPTIDLRSCSDPVLRNLVEAFRNNKIELILKDFSLGMPLPTVAALAWDPSTFPETSEIVFTAGTASSPQKAAIRAITEVAQLGGDFCASSRYEASGLPKPASLEECGWILEGPEVSIDALPGVENDDIRRELEACLADLGVNVYAVETTHPELGIPAHYCMAPGLEFLERDINQSLGLFVGRKLAEEEEISVAEKGLDALARICPKAHYLPFFRGIVALRKEDTEQAASFFEESIPLQPDNDALGMAAFYAGYALSQNQDWQKAVKYLENAARLCPQTHQYVNYLGVALYKTGQWERAEQCFGDALKIDKGSAIDYANRGLCREKQGDLSEAAEDFRIALALDSELAFAREHLAALEETKGA